MGVIGAAGPSSSTVFMIGCGIHRAKTKFMLGAGSVA
jgi:hypothetical protein